MVHKSVIATIPYDFVNDLLALVDILVIYAVVGSFVSILIVILLYYLYNILYVVNGIVKAQDKYGLGSNLKKEPYDKNKGKQKKEEKPSQSFGGSGPGEPNSSDEEKKRKERERTRKSHQKRRDNESPEEKKKRQTANKIRARDARTWLTPEQKEAAKLTRKKYKQKIAREKALESEAEREAQLDASEIVKGFMKTRDKELEFLQKKEVEFNNEPHIEQSSWLAESSRTAELRAVRENSFGKEFSPEDLSSEETYTGKGKGKSFSKRK